MATKMVSMKIDKAERDRRNSPKSIAEEGPIYPWGLALNIDGDTIEKLGIEKLPEVGATMMLAAKVKVTGTSSTDHEHGKHKSINLQITEMALVADGDDKDAAGSIYKG